MRTPHTSCRQGKRVVIILRDGGRVFGVFRERKGRFIVLDRGRRIDVEDVRSFRIARGMR